MRAASAAGAALSVLMRVAFIGPCLAAFDAARSSTEQRLLPRAARLDVHLAQLRHSRLALLAYTPERGFVDGAAIVVDQRGVERLRHPLCRKLHLIECADRIRNPRNVEQKDGAGSASP